MISRGLAPQTIKNAMNLARVYCAELVENEMLDVNPFLGLKLPKAVGSERVGDGWTVLDPDEQLDLLDQVSDDEYHFVAFGLGTGLRLSEIINLKLEDIDLESWTVTVRRSKGGKRTKGGKVRLVPLIGIARQAAVAAVEHATRVGCEYAFPSPRTGRKRFDGRQPFGWKLWLKSAGFKRRVRFHDLRHTCATALLAGWWGRTWTLKEVQQIMGHAQQSTTERYAHMLDETVLKAGAETAGLDPTAWGNEPGSRRSASSKVGFGTPRVIQGFQRVAIRRRFNRPALHWAGSKSRGVKIEPRRWARVGVEFWGGRKSSVAA